MNKCFRKMRFPLLTVFLLLTATLVYPQISPSLDEAIESGVRYLSGRFPRGTIAATLSIQSENPELSQFVLQKIRINLVNGGWFTVVERGSPALDVISKEMDYQLSGYVSDETSLSIGKQLGAEIIISGALNRSGQNWRLDLQALRVESAQIAGQWSIENIRPEPAWISLAAQRTPAQEIDNRIRVAVDSLAGRLNSPMELSIGKITLAETEMSSELSLYLSRKINHHAVNNQLFRVTVPTRSLSGTGQDGSARGSILGSFSVEGDTVEVLLQLVSEPNNISLGSQRFSIQRSELRALQIDMLPANISTQEEAKKHEGIFSTQVQASSASLKIEAWPNSYTYTYFNGEDLLINLIASHDCYFKVYHVDINNKMQMIYPNAINRDNRLRANVARTIPEDGMRYNIQAPFGQDSIIVVASNQPFTNLEAEFGKIENATRDTVGNVMRGLGMQAVSPSQSSVTVSTRFSYTSLARNPAIE